MKQHRTDFGKSCRCSLDVFGVSEKQLLPSIVYVLELKRHYTHRADCIAKTGAAALCKLSQADLAQRLAGPETRSLVRLNAPKRNQNV